MSWRGSRFGLAVVGALALLAGQTQAEEPSPAEIKAAYTAAVTWLVEHQSADGRWDSDAWTDAKPGAGNEFGDARYDVGLTGLAVLALLETDQPGKSVSSALDKALAWLQGQQAMDGSLGFGQGEEIYNHALASLALSKAVAKKHDVKDAAQKALGFCIKAQNPGFGWKYGVKSGRNDSSVSTWMLLCLKAGQAARLDGAFKGPLTGAANWFERATANNGDVGYESPGGGSAYLPQNDGKFDPLPVMTAAALHALGPKASAAGAMATVIGNDLPSWPDGSARKTNFYYWYHGTLALKAYGGDGWPVWRAEVLRALLSHQVADKGGLLGSWPPVAEWSLAGGRVYGTAINALTLSACR